MAKSSNAANCEWTRSGILAPGKDHPVTLTVTEFLLLKALASRPGESKAATP
jgi:hypothetical protein